MANPSPVKYRELTENTRATFYRELNKLASKGARMVPGSYFEETKGYDRDKGTFRCIVEEPVTESK